MKDLAAVSFPLALSILAATTSLAVASSPAPDLTSAVVPDFRGWEHAYYAGWNDWSGLDAAGLFALPDDPASDAPYARFRVSGSGTALSSGGPGVLCTDGIPVPMVEYGGPFGQPVQEVVVQVKSVGTTAPTLYLEYFGDVPFNPDTDILTPIEVTELAPGEAMYRFLAAADGLGIGSFGNFYGFVLHFQTPGSPSPGCIDAIQLDVRHTLVGQTETVCPGTSQVNSASVYAGIDAGGSSFAADNLFKLTASGIPQASYGFFLASQSVALVPCMTNCGSQGQLCLRSPIARLLPAGLGGSDFSFSRTIDLSSIPLSPPVAVTAGSTWHFQAWYRDANPTLTSNFTQTTSVMFR